MTDLNALLILLSAVIVLTVLQLLWNRLLRNRVEARTAELRQTNHTLTAQAARLSDLYSHVSCGYHSLDANGVFVDINETELRWLGCTRDEIIGKREFAGFLDEAGGVRFRAASALFKAGGAAHEQVAELIARDGSRKTVAISSSALFDTQGDFTQSHSTVYDITQQESAARALRATLDNMPNVAVQWFDVDGRVCFWNKAATAIYGWNEQEAMGRTLDELGIYTPAQARDFLDNLQDMDSTGQALDPAESTFSRKDGSLGIIVSTLFPIPAPTGKTYFACMDVDVTERYQSEERLRATLENTPGVAIQWFDREARVLYWNPASEMLYGIDADEAIGRRMDELLQTPEQYQAFVAFLGEVERGHESSGVAEATVQGRHGVTVTVIRQACVIPGVRAEPIFACMEVDITDKLALEREREQLNVILSRVTEAIPVCLSYFDAEDRYVWTNARNASRLGADASRLIGRVARDVNIELTGHWNGGTLEAALDGKPQHDEYTFQDTTGETRDYERFRVPDTDGEGVLRGCTSVWVDITARKEAENKIRRLNRVYSVLSNINAALVRIKNRHTLFEEACRIAVEHGGFGVVWVGLVNPLSGNVESLSWAGEDAATFIAMEQAARDQRIEKSGILSQCIREKRPVFNNDIAAQTMQAGTRRRRAAELGYQSAIVMPLMVNGEVAGLFGMMAHEKNFFTEEEVRLLTDLSADVAFALEVIEKEKRIDYLAYYDALTELPNRNLLNERLGQLLQTAAARGARLAVLLLDIRRFRFVNESLGRQSGDKAIREFAQRLRASWPEADNVGRVSGDHFALVLGDCGNEAELLLAIERSIIGAFKLPFEVDDHEFNLSAVAGIALYPDDGTDVDTLFRNAEAALKQAKAASEQYMFYQPQMNARMTQTLRLESKMRRALENNAFVLHYQPKVQADSARIVGFEALIRWNDPDSGLVAPGDFIPILEETGMIVEVGQWAIARVLQDQAAWRQQGLAVPRIAVNVSAVQLRRKGFSEQIRVLLDKNPDHSLDLEITESLLMEDIEGCITKLIAIRDMGVNIAIDDFGTGYSSLAYLSRLPVNALKIDRSFIHGMLQNSENMSIVSSVISLAHALKIKVIAEGVENTGQLDVLRSLACDEIQGFLISRPVDASGALAMLREGAALGIAQDEARWGERFRNFCK